MKMRESLIFMLCILALLFSGCNAVETVSKDILMEKTTQWKEPKVAKWYYKGSSDRYDYFINIDLDIQAAYRVPLGGISLSQRFPPTEDKQRWVVMPWGPLNKVKDQGAGANKDPKAMMGLEHGN